MAIKKKIEEEITDLGCLTTLTDLGYSYIKISFSGSGDSGDIEPPEFLKKEDIGNEDIRDIFIKHDINRERTEEIPEVVLDFIANKADSLTQDHDWWNNDGGYGIIIIDLEKNKYITEYNIAFVNHEHYDVEGAYFLED